MYVPPTLVIVSCHLLNKAKFSHYCKFTTCSTKQNSDIIVSLPHVQQSKMLNKETVAQFALLLLGNTNTDMANGDRQFVFTMIFLRFPVVVLNFSYHYYKNKKIPHKKKRKRFPLVQLHHIPRYPRNNMQTLLYAYFLISSFLSSSSCSFL